MTDLDEYETRDLLFYIVRSFRMGWLKIEGEEKKKET